jgi:uncharacterized cupin superfamily protein
MMNQVLHRYAPGDDVGELEHWPFDNPVSNYRIVRGDPRASGRLDEGGPGHQTRFGIWKCTEGAFECTEQGDELMMVLSGRCTITVLDTGSVHELSAGDSILMRDGSRVVWDVHEDVTKVFFACKPEGY